MSPTCSAWPKDAVAASRILPRMPGCVSASAATTGFASTASSLFARSPPRHRAGDANRHRHRQELERDPRARELVHQLEVQRREEEHGEEAEARRERDGIGAAVGGDAEVLEPYDGIARLPLDQDEEHR